MRISKAISGNLVTGFLGRMVGALTPVLLVPFMIRAWGLEIYGEWLILTAIPSYIMLAPDFGLAGAVVNRMAYLTAEGNEQEAVYIYRSSFVVLIIASGGFVGFGWLIAGWLDWVRVGVTALVPGVAAGIIGWSCLQIFINQQGFLLSGIYRSARRNSRLGLLQSAGQIFYLGTSLMALWLGCSPYHYAIVLTLASTLFFMVLFIDCRRIMPNFTLSLHGVSLQCVRPYMVPGLGHAGMPLVNGLQNQGVLLVLGSVLGPASVGLFQTARVLSNGVKSVIGLLASAIVVELPALLGENRKGMIERLLIRNTQIGSSLAIGSIVMIFFEGEGIYRLWLGDHVTYPSLVVSVLLVSLMPFVVGQSFTILLLASNQIHLTILPCVAVAVGSIGCVGIGASLADLSGAAFGVLLLEIGITTVISVITSNNSIIKIRSYFKECFNLKLLSEDIRSALRILLIRSRN
jgi:O-antigen/teichoic acid export membrane protein